MKILKLLCICAGVMTIMVAGKNCSNGIDDGTYTGMFKVVYDSGTYTGKAVLQIAGDQYQCEGNDDRIPAGGSGTFTLKGGTAFFHDENMWTADFDWNLILKGEYQYVSQGRKLRLSLRKKDGAYYEYDLAKD